MSEDGDQEGETEVEADAIVLDAAARVQCLGCGSVLSLKYEFDAVPEEERDDELIPEGSAVCKTCTANRGVRTVVICGFPAGVQFGTIEQALNIVNDMIDEDETDGEISGEGGGGGDTTEGDG